MTWNDAKEPAGEVAPKRLTWSALPWYAKVGVVFVLVAPFGHVHFVYGAGIDVCQKESWSLAETFVDVRDYAGQPLVSLLPKAHVVRALIACEVLDRPGAQ